ncbi:hypothetical protein [Idiomarina seosinensis]|uniref:Uncharacterized protein n=1 Tax=Idiomarina seosinensis TaxID=281739 RepID=A0A432ZIC4_9GAMM|nr:hypothetical protein [Idiomarina seosinensis]RUO77775.1 hypothetical protein CWI81_04665 [Idiomarina seosinensis]
MNLFIKRTLKIGLVLNAPPVLLVLSDLVNLDIVPVIFAGLLWMNIPLQYLGMASLFEPTQLQFEEFGVTAAAPTVWCSVVAFWVVISALISYLSLLRVVKSQA